MIRILCYALMYKKNYHLSNGHLCFGANTTAGKKHEHFPHLNLRGATDFGNMVCCNSGHSMHIFERCSTRILSFGS